LAALLALGASLSWGVGDFLGGVKARVLPSLLVMAASQPFGLAALGLAVAVRGTGIPRRRGWRWAALSAVLGHDRTLRLLPRHGGGSDQRRRADRRPLGRHFP
jgi:drug/metabolite transporter (DMT)-like permease